MKQKYFYLIVVLFSCFLAQAQTTFNDLVICSGETTEAIIANRVCQTVTEGGSITLTAPTGFTFSSVPFASYGTPGGTCGNFSLGNCHAASSQSVVEGLLIGQNSATIGAYNTTFTDPCSGITKRLFVEALYGSVTWTNDTPSIGLAANGSGEIPAFTAINNTESPIVATISILFDNGFTTATSSYTITVYPIPSVPLVSTPVFYAQNDTASALTATTGGSGLLWYTAATGGAGNTTAPIPDTSVLGTTSYWVSSTNDNGCESERVEVVVNVNYSYTLTYTSNASMTAGSGLQGTLTNFSTCQSAFSATFYAAGYSGSWSNGNFNYYVNDVLVGSGSGTLTVDLTAYIPINSLKIIKTNYSNWNQVSITAEITTETMDPVGMPTVSNVAYCLNDTASPLTASLTGNGSELKWYTSVNGKNYSATAPTPSTATAGTVSYWVAQSDAGGCEGERQQIDVTIAAPVQISTQPQDQTITESDSLMFSVAASNATSYQWQVSMDGGFNWQTLDDTITNPDVLGSTTNTLTVSGANMISLNGYLFRVLLTSPCGNIVSNEALATVTLGTTSFSSDNGIKIYPNPFKDNVFVTFNDVVEAELRVLDINGRLLKNQKLNSAQNTINMNDLPSGLYFFQITSDAKTTVQKIIKK